MSQYHDDEPLFGGGAVSQLPTVGLRGDVYRAWWVRERLREMMSEFYATYAPPPKDDVPAAGVVMVPGCEREGDK